ncbi:MAG: 4Fe-4S dicluster domain-containing protein [Myxococcota bacterium]|jgi:Fe-S-cluster-containing dehydrogenase component|nr:4Fe-4S dicluster domain-containing protein [Myxococcota bacterium]
MKTLTRRGFLGIAGVAGAGVALPATAQASAPRPANPNHDAVLVDLVTCIGCRKCEAACNEANHLPPPTKPFDDMSVFEQRRRPDKNHFTVLNRYPGAHAEGEGIFVKVQCLHCVDPGCVSACIVGALSKNEDTGAVEYHVDKCLGCRYCMVACPFGIPAYEYDEALAPRVRKCELCPGKRDEKNGGAPACVSICPREALTHGTRERMLALAAARIKNHPDQYVDHIYGEKEVGGTGILYIAGVPNAKVDLIDLPEEAAPRLTEAIQHGIFKFFAAPIALFGLLSTAMHLFKDRKADPMTSGTDNKDKA